MKDEEKMWYEAPAIEELSSRLFRGSEGEPGGEGSGGMPPDGDGDPLV